MAMVCYKTDTSIEKYLWGEQKHVMNGIKIVRVLNIEKFDLIYIFGLLNRTRFFQKRPTNVVFWSIVFFVA